MSITALAKRLSEMEAALAVIQTRRRQHEPFVQIEAQSILRDTVTVKIFPEGIYKPPESEKAVTLEKALLVADTAAQSGYFVQMVMSGCREWIHVFIQRNPDYTEAQKEHFLKRDFKEHPELAALYTPEGQTLMDTLARIPQIGAWKRNI